MKESLALFHSGAVQPVLMDVKEDTNHDDICFPGYRSFRDGRRQWWHKTYFTDAWCEESPSIIKPEAQKELINELSKNCEPRGS